MPDKKTPPISFIWSKACDLAPEYTEDSGLCFRFRYVPPYETYKELRRFQLALREAEEAGRGAVRCSLDLSEWAGHAEEEYCLVPLKWLYDHPSGLTLRFLCSGTTERDAAALCRAVRLYLGRTVFTEDRTLNDPESLGKWLSGQKVSKEASLNLALLLFEPENRSVLSHSAIRALLGEVREFSLPTGYINQRSVNVYLDGAAPLIVRTYREERSS